MLGSVVDLLHQTKHFHRHLRTRYIEGEIAHLSLSGHLVAQLGVLVHQIDGEGVMVLATEDVGPTGLPEEGVASGHADRVPELHQVETTALGDQHRLCHGAHLEF